MTDNSEVIVSDKRKLPLVWIVPLVALLLGIYMVIHHYLTQGPEITITYSTANGIEAGKTKIKSLNVEVGVVEDVVLNADLKSVTLYARIANDQKHLLREDSKFWVVRPRIGKAGVSGLGTLLSGAFIELNPGIGQPGKREYKGLEEPPLTAPDTPGIHLNLLSEEAGSVSMGDPVLYRGYEVGNVESTKLDTKDHKLHARIFIKAPFDSLVSSNTRFWNASGISLDASARGVHLKTGSLESILIGGIAFDLPNASVPGTPAKIDDEFKLYPDEISIHENPYKHFVEFLLLFDSSVQGLERGAPVTYRGISVGTVEDVSVKYIPAEMKEKGDIKIPVLIRIEPGRYTGEDTAESIALFEKSIHQNIQDGGRATIKLANLLTGARMIAFNFYDDVEPATVGKLGDYRTLPTISTGVEELQHKVSDLLEKLNKLPLNTVLTDADTMINQLTLTLENANTTVKDLNKILENQNTQQIPESIYAVLEELQSVLKGLSPDSDFYQDLSESIAQLNATMRNIEQLTYTIDTKPNSLIFSKPKQKDLQPEAATQ